MAKDDLRDRRELGVSEPSQGLADGVSVEELGFRSLQVGAGAAVQDAQRRRPRRRAEPRAAAGMVQA